MDIVERLKRKDEEAYEELVQKYSNAFFYMAKKVIEDREDCKDCVQEIFLKIFSKIEQYNSNEGNFNAWIIQVAKNQIIDFYRVIDKNKNIVLSEELVKKVPTQKTDTHISIVLDELQAYLTTEEYDILIYKIVSNLTFEQIGAILNMEKYTVRRRFLVVYKKAREFVNRKGYLNVKER